MKRFKLIWIALVAFAMGASAQTPVSANKIANDLDQALSLLEDTDTQRAVVQFDQPSSKSDISSFGGTLKRIYGHGTHVAGIIGGNSQCSESNMTKQFRGIAPAVNIIALRALNAQGSGTDSAVIAAIDRAIALKTTYNIRVLNLSMGRGVKESYTLDPLCQAVERAWNAGIVVVASAGNMGRYAATKGYGMISSPGNDPFIITVGALNDKLTTGRADDVMATFSSKGPTLVDHVVKPDLVAPGNGIVSAMAMGTTLTSTLRANAVARSYYISNGLGNSSSYFKLSGTSMAAPMVSGAAALLLHKNPNMTPNQVKARLMRTASKTFPRNSVSVINGVTYTTYYDAFTVGAGYLDINSALANNDLVTTSLPLSPQTIKVAGKLILKVPVSTLFGNGLVWGGGLVWGDGLIWGDAAIMAESTDSLIWGERLIWGESLIWGEATKGKGDN